MTPYYARLNNATPIESLPVNGPRLVDHLLGRLWLLPTKSGSQRGMPVDDALPRLPEMLPVNFLPQIANQLLHVHPRARFEQGLQQHPLLHGG